jgi:hypothetical protein
MTMLDRRNFIEELKASRPCSPELESKAREHFSVAMRDLSLSTAVMENRIAMLCDPVFLGPASDPHERLTTLAVTARPGTGIILVIDAMFFAGAELDPADLAEVLKAAHKDANVKLISSNEGRVWAIVHEGQHVEKKHLLTNYSGPSWDLACEVVSNADVQSTLKTGMLQVFSTDQAAGTVDRSSTEEFGVNPKKIWEKYKDDLKEQGKSYVDYSAFTSSDLACMAELDKMTKLPKPPRGKGKGGASQGWPCPHHGGDPLPFDQDEIDDAMSEVIDTAVRKATVEKDPRFKSALEKLYKQTKGDEGASKIWGDHGVGEMFGEAVNKREVQFWAQWLRRNIGSRLAPGRALVYNRRTVAVDQQLRRDPILAYRGKKRRALLWVEVDSSGSMSWEQLEWVRKHIGVEKNVDIEYHNFDTARYDIEWGKPFSGRGGTDFRCVEEAYKEARRKPDAVLVVTDGYAQEITPSDARKWVWLITSDGTDWPARAGMACYKLPPVPATV